MLYRKSNSGFTIIEVILAIAGLIILVGLGSFIYVTRFHQPKTPDAFHQKAQASLADAKTYSKQLAASITIEGDKVDEGGVDTGCTITADKVFGPDAVDCRLFYGVQYKGTGDPAPAVQKIVDKLNSLGMHPQGASAARFDEYKQDPTYLGAFPLEYDIANKPTKYQNASINVTLYTNASRNDPTFAENTQLQQDFSKYGIDSNSFLYGYVVYLDYYQAKCSSKCQLQNSPSSGTPF